MEEIEKFRGQYYDFAAIDEVKSFSPVLVKELVQDILQPALLDTRGTLVLIGTPGAVLAGPFWQLTTQIQVDGFGTVRPYAERHTPEWTKSNGHMKGANWSFHKWTSKDNIRMPHIWEDAQNDKEQNGWDDYHPTWLREYLGQWAPNEDALVYGYARSNQGSRLDYTPDQSSTAPFGLPENHDWQFILGLDLGTKDDTAFVVAAWSETHPNLYYVHAEKHVGWEIGGIVSRTKELEKMFGGFMIRVADTGGLGTMVVESMASLFGVDFIAAKKSDKPSHIKLLNADLAAARIQVLPTANELVEEWMTLQWGDTEHLKEDKRAPNHCADAALYVWRFAYHHLWEHEERGPAPGTDAWWRAKEKQDEERYRQQLLAEEDMQPWEQWRDEIQEQDQLWTLLNSLNS